MPVRSLELGLVGRCDVVGFRLLKGRWQPYPVEYKRGRPKKDNSDRVQLCAQALCLEEMLSVEVPAGALYYGKKKRRSEIVFDHSLRTITRETSKNLHELTNGRKTPPPQYSHRCKSCSFVELCLPETAGRRSVSAYIKRMTG